MRSNSNAPPIYQQARIHWVGGKGGVGKTTMACRLSQQAADVGEKVLLISTDPAHNLSDVLARSIGHEPCQVTAHWYARELDPDQLAGEHLERVQHQLSQFVRPAQRPALARQLALSRQAPGAVEAALVDYLASTLRAAQGEYDRIIMDTAPTGHTLRLLQMPGLMSVWARGLLRQQERSTRLGQVLAHLGGGGLDRDSEAGPLAADAAVQQPGLGPREQAIAQTLEQRTERLQWLQKSLADHQRTAIWWVLTPEKLPVAETQRAVAELLQQTLPVRGLFLNRVLEDAGEHPFWQARRHQQEVYIREVQRTLPQLAQYQVPLLARDVVGLEQLQALQWSPVPDGAGTG